MMGLSMPAAKMIQAKLMPAAKRIRARLGEIHFSTILVLIIALIFLAVMFVFMRQQDGVVRGVIDRIFG